jgi:uncharacterized lipoprotein YddW (UPF0748 family)
MFFARTFLILTLLLSSASAVSAAPNASSGSSAPLAEWMWALRGSVTDSARAAQVVERAQELGVKALLVQVVGRGDAIHRSQRLPRAEAMGAKTGDPFAYLIERAHAAGIEVHAWVNCFLVWSADRPPNDPDHVVRVHPEWVACTAGGVSLLSLSPTLRQKFGCEGVYLSAAHEGARAWIAGNVAELARSYPVDGIHLDYVRLPGPSVGFDRATRAAFALESGVDRLNPPEMDDVRQQEVEMGFAAFQARQVTALVSAVRESLTAVRTGLTLSAAVRPDLRDAASHYGQDWTEWLATGLLDRAFPMCYSPDAQVVMDQLANLAGRAGAGQIVPGIAVYNAPPTRVVSHLKGARALGFPALALYSYDSLFERAETWERLARLSAGGQEP